MSDQSISSASTGPYRYIITETSAPTSLDPLDADNTANLPVARMIYATPLEASDDNQLKSQILESFRYDPEARKIEWILKDDLKYEDGSPLTAEDVAFAVARMAYTRPKFPVIEHISGLQQWLKKEDALKSLPSGIVVSGNRVSIALDKNVKHPLFRFCLELFSVIPKRCVDVKINKLSCDKIPSSGHYRVELREGNRLVFAKRSPGKIEGAPAPEQIQFEYLATSELPKKLNDLHGRVVVAGNESMFSPDDMRKIEGQLTTRFLPAARFSVIQLNQNAKAFVDLKCRQYFAENFRQAFQNFTKQPFESGVFTKILPGYLSTTELASEFTLSKKDQEACQKHFSKTPIAWGYTENEKDAVFFQVLKKTFERIGMKPSAPILASTRSDAANLYATGKIAIFNAGSGFWALDPAGDMKMLFTPNLHKPLQHITDDSKLQSLIEGIEDNPQNYEKVNRYLYKDAKFNTYAHLRRFFAAKEKNILADLAFAVTSPAPWQVFKVEK